MPKLVRLYIVNVAIGFALSAVFVGLLVWLDIARLGHLVLETEHGWIGGLMMFVSNGVIFAGAQFAIAVMRMADPDDGPRGGTRASDQVPVPVPVPVPVRVAVESPRSLPRR